MHKDPASLFQESAKAEMERSPPTELNRFCKREITKARR